MVRNPRFFVVSEIVHRRHPNHKAHRQAHVMLLDRTLSDQVGEVE